MKTLKQPFNDSHADSRCENNRARSGRLMRHKFLTASKAKVRNGVYDVTLECTFCKSTAKITEDYTVLASAFSL